MVATNHRSPAQREPRPEGYDPTAYEHPSVSVDVALISTSPVGLQVLLTRRREAPYLDHWALPGGFVAMNEALQAAAVRVLATKAGVEKVYLEQLYTFGAPNRDPRTRVITVAYYALVEAATLDQRHSREETVLATLQVPWQGEIGGPVTLVDPNGSALDLAFDHTDILGMVVKRMRGKLNYTPIGYQLLPARFTLRQLQDVHEAVLGRSLNKDSFRRRMLASGDLEPTGESETQVGHRPAALYRFTQASAV